MAAYFSTFISGFQDAVNGLIKDMVKDAVILMLLDGLIIYETKTSLEAIKAIKIFNNTFLLIDKYKLSGPNPIEFAIKQFLKMNKQNDKIMSVLRNLKAKTFRIVTSKENKLTSINGNLKKIAETKICKDYMLQCDRSEPDIEFWVVERREGIVLTGLRITKQRSSDMVLLRGELRPELSNLLCWMSEPSANDVFLDPFCGYGSIPMERSSLMSYKEIIASDIDSKKLLVINNKIGDTQVKSNFRIMNIDFFKKGIFEANSIDKIVTDPPWGDFEELRVSPYDFYCRFITTSLFCLKQNGILVFLTSRKEDVEAVLIESANNLKMLMKLDILVSGKKAGVYKVVKIC